MVSGRLYLRYERPHPGLPQQRTYIVSHDPEGRFERYRTTFTLQEGETWEDRTQQDVEDIMATLEQEDGERINLVDSRHPLTRPHLRVVTD